MDTTATKVQVQKRSAKWTEGEPVFAVQLILDRYDVLQAKFRGVSQGAREKEKVWQEIADQLNAWCSTCNTWRTYLLKTAKSPNVIWEHTHSWNWPLNSEHIAEVYLPTTRKNKCINLKDISTACFIWENCKSGFNIRHFIIRRIREFRNKYFAHNPSLKASELEKAQVFDMLQDLLRDPDVNGHIDVQECIDGLTDIKQGDPNTRWMKEMQDRFDQQGASLALIKNKLEEDSCYHKCIYKQIKTYCQTISTGIRWKTPFGMILIVLLIGMIWIKPYEVSQLGCISEQYTFPFKQDLPLLGYLREHKFLVGRSWLIKELEDEVVSAEKETVKMLVVVAEMGYGKSALVSNLLCPVTSESASILHKHIVAFHVCKFDVRSTHYAERFIRRLVGFLAMKSGEYGNIISMLPESSILYDRDSCDKEPEACFDQGITLPLKKISDAQNVPWVIVIDALDECEHSGKNQILHLLSSRMKQLPTWLKVLITSRNITSLHTLRKTKLKYLSASDSRNMDDIRAFIYQTFPADASHKVIDNLIERSDGNFMYIIHASKLIAEQRDITGRSVDLPKDLGDIYEINFDRQFEKEHSYTIPKKILEIVCSTLNPVNRMSVFTILQTNGVLQEISEFNTYFQSLVFFLRVGKDVQIAHQALYLWLISEQNENYRISLQEGHTQISRYLFSTMKNNRQKDLVNLAIHCAESADPTILKMFVSLKLNDNAAFKRKSYLHQLIWRTPSVKALKLLLNYYPEVDVKNEGNVTPAFFASGRGHVEQLKLLHRKGADLSFTVQDNFAIPAKNVLRNIELMKQKFYSGYSLLHVAAQHGHAAVVLYLINHNKSIINKTNTLGLNAGDTACENGRLDVIELLFNINPNLIGYKCLFYAAKNNHVAVIDWLFRRGVKFDCVSDRRAEEAMNFIFGNVSLEFPIAVFQNEPFAHIHETVNPVDEWWTVFKINPLHIAIRMGSNDTAGYLISNFPDNLRCVDALGYTAALTSVLYNRTDLLPLLKKQLVSDRCAKVSAHIEKLFPYVSEDIDTSVCPEGGGFPHIVASHYLDEVVLFSLRQGLNKLEDWNKPDNLGNYPIHYAAANTNIMFMVLMERMQFSHENARALNGSTSFHIAAITGQQYFLFYCSQSFKLSFPDLRDKRNRGLLHYTVMRHFPNNPIGSMHELQSESVMIFKYFSDTCHHDLNSLDDYGRNVLHYALRYGHYLVISYFKQSHPNVLSTLLFKRDKTGLNPIRYALLEYQEGTQSFVLPEKCTFFNVFSTLCSNAVDFSIILSPFERGIIYLTDSFTPSEFFQFLEPNLEHIVKKSVYLLVLVLATNYKHLNVQILKGILMITYKRDPLMKYKHFAIARYKPEIFRVCDKLLSKSPLHFLMLNGEFKNSVFSFNQRDVDYYLDLIFRKNSSLLSCEDSKGYNIFHYSLIGGNIMAGRILMHRNINTVNNHISFKDIFMLALLSRQNSDPKNFMNCNRQSFYQSQEDCTDIFLLEYFKNNRKHLLPIDFCKNGASELSLVHLLSANGMLRTLEIVVDTFGSDILSCINRHSITPLYLGKLFDQTSVVLFIENRIKFDFPDRDTEEWLLWLLVNVFSDVQAFDKLLCLSHYASFNFLTYRKLRNEFSCLKEMTIYPVLDKTITWTYTYIIVILERLQYLLSRFEFFENAFHFHDRRECRTLHLLLNESYHDLHFFCLLYQTETFSETSLYRANKRLSQKFKVIAGKADIAFRQYLQNTPSDLCFTSDEGMRNEKMFYMYKSAKNIFYLMRNWLKEAAIYHLMQVTKSIKVKFPDNFTFLRERMRVFKFPTSDKVKQHHAVPLITDSPAYFNQYKYLHILKPSLVYKDFKDKISRFFFEHNDFMNYKTKILEFIHLLEPFKDYQNHSSTTNSLFYN